MNTDSIKQQARDAAQEAVLGYGVGVDQAADAASAVWEKVLLLAPLVAAYHAVFDAKDRLTPGDDGWYPAYEAAAKINRLIVALGGDAVERYDNHKARRTHHESTTDRRPEARLRH